MFARTVSRSSSSLLPTRLPCYSALSFTRAMATTAATTHLDVAKEVKIDHDNVRELFTRYNSTTEFEEKKRIASTLVREMAIHSDAEEISVYNTMLERGFVSEIEQDKKEHAEVKRLVHQADTTHMKNPDYDSALTAAVNAFISHATEEENDQLPRLVAALSQEENTTAAQNFLKARTTVPSRAHPRAPQSGGVAQKLAGAQGKVHDKVIETVTGREFVDLKFQHGKQ